MEAKDTASSNERKAASVICTPLGAFMQNSHWTVHSLALPLLSLIILLKQNLMRAESSNKPALDSCTEIKNNNNNNNDARRTESPDIC